MTSGRHTGGGPALRELERALGLLIRLACVGGLAVAAYGLSSLVVESSSFHYFEGGSGGYFRAPRWGPVLQWGATALAAFVAWRSTAWASRAEVKRQPVPPRPQLLERTHAGMWLGALMWVAAGMLLGGGYVHLQVANCTDECQGYLLPFVSGLLLFGGGAITLGVSTSAFRTDHVPAVLTWSARGSVAPAVLMALFGSGWSLSASSTDVSAGLPLLAVGLPGMLLTIPFLADRRIRHVLPRSASRARFPQLSPIAWMGLIAAAWSLGLLAWATLQLHWTRGFVVALVGSVIAMGWFQSDRPPSPRHPDALRPLAPEHRAPLMLAMSVVVVLSLLVIYPIARLIV